MAVNLQRTIDSLNEDIDTLENELFSTREFSSEQATRIVQLDERLGVTDKELQQIKEENMELRVRYKSNFHIMIFFTSDCIHVTIRNFAMLLGTAVGELMFNLLSSPL